MANPKDSIKDKSQQKIDQIAETIKENERRKELRRFHEQWSQRIAIARSGRMAYEQKNLVEAMRCYKQFLDLTAHRYEVSLGDLKPTFFTEESRITESLLVSTVSLDLAKMYDHLTGEDAKRDRRIFLKLFLAFSKGMPFQSYAAENLRKYLEYTRKINNRADFRGAYSQMKNKGCFVATAIYQDPLAIELQVLRNYRDTILLKSISGKAFVAVYYKVGPSLARLIVRSQILSGVTKKLLDKIVAYCSQKLKD